MKRKNPEKIKGRFYIEKASDGGYDLIDDKWGMVINFENKSTAEDSAKFAREYVRKWGDIDFSKFPYSLDDKPSQPDRNYLNKENTKWNAKDTPTIIKTELLYTIITNNTVDYVILKNLNTDENIAIPLQIKNAELNDTYKNALVYATDYLGISKYPNYESSVNGFIKNREKLLTFKTDFEFKKIQEKYNSLK